MLTKLLIFAAGVSAIAVIPINAHAQGARKYAPGTICQPVGPQNAAYRNDGGYQLLNNDMAICPIIKENPFNGLNDANIVIVQQFGTVTNCGLCVAQADGTNPNCVYKQATAVGTTMLTWNPVAQPGTFGNIAYILCSRTIGSTGQSRITSVLHADLD